MLKRSQKTNVEKNRKLTWQNSTAVYALIKARLVAKLPKAHLFMSKPKENKEPLSQSQMRVAVLREAQ